MKTPPMLTGNIIVLSVSLNGEVVQIAGGLTIQQALEQWDYHKNKCAVAINGQFISRTQYSDTVLQEKDDIDIVEPVGGG